MFYIASCKIYTYNIRCVSLNNFIHCSLISLFFFLSFFPHFLFFSFLFSLQPRLWYDQTRQTMKLIETKSIEVRSVSSFFLSEFFSRPSSSSAIWTKGFIYSGYKRKEAIRSYVDERKKGKKEERKKEKKEKNERFGCALVTRFS